MKRWAIVNSLNEEQVDLGWFFDSYTQQDAEDYAIRGNFGIKNNEKVVAVEEDFKY